MRVQPRRDPYPLLRYRSSGCRGSGDRFGQLIIWLHGDLSSAVCDIRRNNCSFRGSYCRCQ